MFPLGDLWQNFGSFGPHRASSLPHPKALRDFQRSATFDEEVDTMAREELQQSWYEEASSFLSIAEQDSTHGRDTRPKRLASFEWLACVDNMLSIQTGQGLRRFQVDFYSALTVNRWVLPPPEEPAPQAWLGLCCDQCTGNISPYCWMAYKAGLVTTLIPDPNHRPNNDLWLAAKTSGFWSIVKLKGISFNVFYGPFDSAGHWQKCLAAANDLALRSGVHDPLFNFYLPLIAKDRDEEHRLSEEGYAEEIMELVFQSLAVSKKRSKMSLTRWGSWYDCWREWAPWHHLRVLCWTYMGIVLGWAVRRPGRALPQLMSTMVPKEASDNKVSMAEEAREAVAKERNASQGTVHAALSIDTNDVYHRRGWMLYTVGSPTRAEQGLQAQQNRGFDESLRWWSSMACGSGLASLVETIKVLGAAPCLKAMGFVLSRDDLGHGPSISAAMLEHEMLLEDEWLDDLTRLVFHTVWHRLKSLMFHWRGWPGRAAQLLSPDLEEVRQGLAYCKGLCKVWENAAAQTLPNVKAMCMRSFMNTPAAGHFFAVLSFVGFETVPQEARACMEATFAIGQTKIQEDCFRCIRHAADQHQSNRKVSDVRKWIIPIQKKVACEVHRYSEIEYTRIPRSDPNIVKRAIPKRFFAPLMKQTSIDCKSIVSNKGATEWSTFNAQSMTCQYGDYENLRAAAETGCWTKVQNSWLCQACPAGQVLQRAAGGLVYWSFGLIGSNTVACWPACEHRSADGRLFLSIKTEDINFGDILLQPIWDLSDWVGYELQWVGPLRQQTGQLVAPGSWPERAPPVLAEAIGCPQPLITIAARNCFYASGPVWLRRLAKHYAIDVAEGANLWDTINSLLRSLLPDLTDEEYANILGKRVRPPKCEELEVDAAAVLETTDVGDVATFDEVQNKEMNEVSAMKAYTIAFKTLMQKVREKKQPPGPPKKRARTSAAGPRAPALRTYSEFDALRLEDARAFMPSAISFGKDLRNSRWWAREAPAWSISRSFKKFGEVPAFSLVCEAAWEWVGSPNPHAWISTMARRCASEG